MSAPFDPYHKWLGIPPAEQPPNHYRLLGIALFEDDDDVITNAADRQMAHVRQFQTGPQSAASQRLLNELAAAKVCLLRVMRKAEYDAALRARLAASAPPELAPPPRVEQLPAAPPLQPPPPPPPPQQPAAPRAPQRTTVAAQAAPTAISPTPDRTPTGQRAPLGSVDLRRPLADKRVLATVAALALLLVVVVAVALRPERNEQAEVGGRAVPTDPNVAKLANPAAIEPQANEKLSGEALLSNTAAPALEPGGAYAVSLNDADRIELAEDVGIKPSEPEFTLECWLRLRRDRESNILIGNFELAKNAQEKIIRRSGWLANYRTSLKEPINDFVEVALINDKPDLEMAMPSFLPQAPSGWLHISMAWDGRLFTTFVNGQPLGTNVPDPQFPPTTSRLVIGRPAAMTPMNPGCSFDIRAFRLSKGVRYRDVFAPPTDFVRDAQTRVLLDFSRGTGAQLPDTSGYFHHAKIISGRWVAVTASDLKATQAPAPRVVRPVAPPARNPAEPAPPLDQGGAYALRLLGEDRIELANTAELLKSGEPCTVEFWLRSLEPQRKTCVVGNLTLGQPPKQENIGAVSWFSNQAIGLGALRFVDASNATNTPSGWLHYCLQSDRNLVEVLINGKHHFGSRDNPFKTAEAGNVVLGTPLDGARLAVGGPLDGILEIRACRLSHAARYARTFTPPKDFKVDEFTTALFDFSAGAGTELFDLSGNKRHGAIVGAKWVAVPANELEPTKQP